MRRILTASYFGILLLVASPLFAADPDASTQNPALTVTAVSLVAASAGVPAAAATTPATPDFTAVVTARYRRPAALPTLYSASAALQGFDAYSTWTALRSGGVEANPFMKPVVNNPAAFIALKASVTTLSIIAAERLWRGHHRGAAIGMMVISNLTMGVVAAHNAQVLASQR